MSMSAAKEDQPGTLLRGADGELYFIPDTSLEAFRIPEKESGPIKDIIGTSPVVTVSVLRGPEAVRTGLVGTVPTTVSVVSISAIRQRKQ